MEISTQYYLLFGGVLLALLVVAWFVMRRGRSQPVSGSPYVEALKLLIDGHNDSAFARLQEAVKAGGAPTDAYIKLGELLRERGDFTRALQIHQSLTVKTDLTRSEKIELFTNLAEDYAGLGNSKKAASVLHTLIQNLNLKDPDLPVTLSRHLHASGQRERAYESLQEARKLGAIGERELALYLTSMAEDMVEKGDARGARKTLQRAMKHDSKCAPALLALGNIAATEGDLDGAIDNWKRVAVLSPELAGTIMQKLERTLFERGRFSEIEQIYRDILGARRDDDTTVSLAAFYDKQGRADDAIDLLENFVSEGSGSVRASMMLTSLYARHRDPETVEKFLEQSSAVAPTNNHYRCSYCKLVSDHMRWHCPRCNRFDSFTRNHVD